MALFSMVNVSAEPEIDTSDYARITYELFQRQNGSIWQGQALAIQLWPQGSGEVEA